MNDKKSDYIMTIFTKLTGQILITFMTDMFELFP